MKNFLLEFLGGLIIALCLYLMFTLVEAGVSKKSQKHDSLPPVEPKSCTPSPKLKGFISEQHSETLLRF